MGSSLRTHGAGSGEAEVQDLHRDNALALAAIDVGGGREEKGMSFADVRSNGGHGESAVHGDGNCIPKGTNERTNRYCIRLINAGTRKVDYNKI